MSLSLAVLLAVSAKMPQDKEAPASWPLVAVVTPLNTWGDKWEDLKARQIAKSKEFLEQTLPKHGLRVLSGKAVDDAVRETKADLLDEDQPRKPLLTAIGKQLHADYVVFGVITDSEQKKMERTFGSDMEGRTTVKLWVIDVAADKAVTSAKSFVGRSGGIRISDGKGSERQVQAAANAFRDGLKDFFLLYPERKR